MSVITANAGDWPTLRALRLQALEEAPYAFGQTLAGAEAMSDDEWMAWATKSTLPPCATFIVQSADGKPIGMAGLFPQKDHPVHSLWGMWVHPEFRRTGAGAALMRAAEAWARSRSARRLNFWVALTNPGAVAFYERLGYNDTGVRSPMSSDPRVSAALYANDL